MYTVTYQYQDDDTGLWHYAEIPCETLDEAEAYEAWAQEMDNIDQDSLCIETDMWRLYSNRKHLDNEAFD